MCTCKWQTTAPIDFNCADLVFVLISDFCETKYFCVFSGIQEMGVKAHLGLKKLYSVCAQSEAADTCVSGIMDFWSGRHLFRVGYGGIIVCELDDE